MCLAALARSQVLRGRELFAGTLEMTLTLTSDTGPRGHLVDLDEIERSVRDFGVLDTQHLVLAFDS